MDNSFKKYNNILGWAMFAISAVVYLMTMARKYSFWDTGEYIVSSAKLSVTHAPGAALFQLLGAVWSGLAFGNGDNYALIINSLSALSSAVTIMLTFWIVTHFTYKFFNNPQQIGKTKTTTESNIPMIIIFGAGILGSSIFMFSDTFWYSAVEGEVYAMASCFTALIVWLACKWENRADEPGNERWLILLAFVIGLSTGVHLMAILALPAAGFIVYSRKFKITWKSFIIANVVIAIILGIVFKFIFPATMRLVGGAELFAVNQLSLPFHSGTAIATLILVTVFYLGLRFTRKQNWAIANSSILAVAFMLLGFSCWVVIPIRANANPHMNLNDPDTALGLLDYFNREQYGDWPIFSGAAYTAHLDDEPVTEKITGYYWAMDKRRGEYRKVAPKKTYSYDKRHVQFFPRMYNPSRDVMQNYAQWYGFPEFNLEAEYLSDKQANEIYNELRKKKEEGTLRVRDLERASEFIEIQPPSFAQHMTYFFDFQVNYMFLRYFKWNFVGRQNDLEGKMNILRGNWLSGIPFIDNWAFGKQEDLPREYKSSKSRNVYFALPLLLGLIGFFVQLDRRFGDWWGLLSLFLLTGVGIIIYTSVKPFEPRERDYALVSAFFAFAIWCGIGLPGLYLFFKRLFKSNWSKPMNIVLTALVFGVPLLMGFQNWDDHDRSKRLTAYAQGHNYLNHLEKDAIVFVYGDNDTYPIWAIQETEGFRDDVKVANYTLLSSSWNVSQNKRKTYNAKPIDTELDVSQYQRGKNEYLRFVSLEELNELVNLDEESLMSIAYRMNYPDAPLDEETFNKLKPLAAELKKELVVLKPYAERDSLTAKEAIEFVKNDSPAKKVLRQFFGDDPEINFVPTNRISIPVNKKNAIAAGIIRADEANSALDYINVNINKGALYKSGLFMLDMFSKYDWSRAIYFSGGGMYDDENVFFLKDYLQNEGFVYKLIPIRTSEKDQLYGIGRIDSEILYNAVKNFNWANYNVPDASFDETGRNYTYSYRNMSIRLARKLIEEGKTEKAKEILDLVMEKIPMERYFNDLNISQLGELYFQVGEKEKANEIFNKIEEFNSEKVRYLEGLPDHHLASIFSEYTEAKENESRLIYSKIEALIADKDSANAKTILSKKFDETFKGFKTKQAAYELDGADYMEQRVLATDFEQLQSIIGIMYEIDSVTADEKVSNLEALLQ